MFELSQDLGVSLSLSETLSLLSMRLRRLILRHRGRLLRCRLRRSWTTQSRRSRRRSRQNLAQFLGIEMARHRDPILIGQHVGLGFGRLLQVRRQREEGNVLAVGQILLRRNYQRVPRKVFLDQLEIPGHDEEQQVNDDRDPGRLALPRTREIVLQLNQQVGNVRIGIAIGSLPVAHVVEPKLLRLRLFGRSDWVLEWNLRDRHALG